MNDELINISADDDESYSAIARLIDLGRQKTYVTIDDILHIFPDAEQDVEQLEEAFSALLSAGIPYLEDSILEEPPDEDLEITDEEDSGAEILFG
jgi:RNA polymerase primary sigma factor